MKLRCVNLSYRIHRKTVLAQINHEVGPGELHFLLGRNGTGKTSLLRLMAHLERPSSGSIEIRDSQNWQVTAASSLHKNLAWVPSESLRPFDFSVMDTVQMGRFALHHGFPQSIDRQICLDALTEIEMQDSASQPITALSSGEFQRVLIARALALQPKILVLDEPSAHLDWPSCHRFFKKIRKLVDLGMGAIVSVHDPELAFKYATHVIGLSEGRLSISGRTADIPRDHLIHAVFGEGSHNY